MAKHMTHLHLTPLVLDNTQPDLAATVADLAVSAAEALARLGLDEDAVQELHEAADAARRQC